MAGQRMDSAATQLSGVKQITLSLTARYASSWGTWEGIRELVQNWHDGILEAKEHLNLPVWATTSFRQMPSKGFLLEQYQAFATVDDGTEIVLGNLTYDGVHNKLTLINKNTSLHKKILLMGYSKKAETRQVIGQFGEGLKIGALSLVREGRVVTMETSCDRWQFDLAEDENFGEKVLTVFVSDRSADFDTEHAEGDRDDRDPTIGPEDTATRVTLEVETWKIFKKRFLFFTPPNEFVNTEVGTLLLDSVYQGQLYVKGVWVSDLSAEDLTTGVNFAQLQLDRDRNAVPRPSEIDHIVSCMWIKALEKRPQLASQYYRLLWKNCSRDVRHAVEYASEKLASLMAEQFMLEHGENVFAISHSATQRELELIRNELKKKVVLCNSTLMDILFKSGKHISLDQALANQRPAEHSVRPFQLLSSDEQLVVRHAAALVGLVDKGFKASLIDVLDTTDLIACRQSGQRVLVPYWMVNSDLTHKSGPLCQEQTKCMCREARLCCAVLQVREPLLAVRTYLLDTLPPDLDHILLYVLQHLCLQICRMAVPFCDSVHKEQPQNLLDASQVHEPHVTHKVCMEREAALQKELSELQSQLQKMQQEQSCHLEEVKARLQSAEKELIGRELSLVNSEQKLEEECERRVHKAQQAALEKVKKLEGLQTSLENENTTVRQELRHSQETVKQLRAQIAVQEPSMDRKNAGLMEELLHYVQQCRKRTKSLQRVCKEQLESKTVAVTSKEKYQLLYDLSCILTEDLQKDKFLCIICARKRKEVLLSPCGHYQLCNDCVSQMAGLCPTCREPILSIQKVYE